MMFVTAQGMGFCILSGKTLLSPPLSVQWLGLVWDSRICTLHLSPDALCWVRRKMILVLPSVTFTHKLWVPLLGSLNVVVEVIPFDKIFHIRLVW